MANLSLKRVIVLLFTLRAKAILALIKQCRLLGLAALTLTSCQQQPAAPADPQRIAFEQTPARQQQPLPSPDTSLASWSVDANGKAIHFGNTDTAPLLSLDCTFGDNPAQLTIIRHASGLPGQTALFPIYGNGVRSRFLADTRLTAGEWRWEAALRADDAQLDVFAGSRELIATLPGKGTLEIAGSRIPGEFVEWCRAGGRVIEAEANEQEELDEATG